MRQLARLADGHRMARRYVYMGVWDCSRQRDRARSLRAWSGTQFTRVRTTSGRL